MMVSFFYDFLFFMPVAITALSFLHGLIAPEDAKIPWVVIALLTGLFLLLMKHLKIRGKAILSGIFLAALIGGWIILPSEKRFDILERNLWIFWEILIVLVCFIASEFAERYRKARIVIAAGGIVLLIFLLVREVPIPKIAVGMVFLYAIFTIMDILQRRSVKEGDPDPKKHIAALSPFLLILLLATMLIKAPDKPYDWGFVKKIGQFVKSEYILISEKFFGQGWDSGQAVIGFSDRGRFGGDLAVSPRTVMEVTARSECDRNMYVAGKRFDTFDGKEWKKNNTSTTDEQLLDSIETYGAILANKGDDPVSDYIHRSNITIQYRDMHTMCVFEPAKTLPNRMLVQYRTPNGGDYLFVDSRAADEKYDIAYYRINRDSENFYKIAVKPQKITEEIFDQACEELEINGAVTYEDYQKYHDSIREKYLPETKISRKMQTYMDKLLAGADSDYEKLRRMEEMFHSFHYTHSPGDLPDSIESEADYLDYFIFDKQEGYCSYYATAFVLLARANGIPARYVQGYAVPMGKRRFAEVDSSSGHAWPEAYLEGIGWIRFEPTPGMRVTESWFTDEELKNNKKEEVEEATVVLPPSVRDEEPEKEPIHLSWYQIVIPIAAGVLFVLMIFAVAAIVRAIRYRRLNEREKAVYLCKNSLDSFKRIHMGRKEDETLSEFRQRASEEIDCAKLEFIPAFEEILYSEREVTKEERKGLEKTYKEIRKFCRPHSPLQFFKMYVLRKKR